MPHRHEDLFDRIASFRALHAAARRAIAGKRRKPGAAAFHANLERELLRLEAQLHDGSYRTGGYLELVVRDPKRRVVSAAPFRDRVVHHALVAVIGPIFERGFIDDTYANRLGHGTHRAVARFERLRDRCDHVLRADIWRYFPAIDHAVLKRDLRRRIACQHTLALCDTIIDGSNPQEPAQRYFPGDDLFSPSERRRGLPLGNLTSQFAPMCTWTASIIGSRRCCARPTCATSTTSRCLPTIRCSSRSGARVSSNTCAAAAWCCIRPRP